MAKSKAKKPIRHLLHIGKGLYRIALPPQVVRSLGWKQGQRLLVKRMPRGILIRDAMTKRSQ